MSGIYPYQRLLPGSVQLGCGCYIQLPMNSFMAIGVIAAHYFEKHPKEAQDAAWSRKME